MWSIAPLVRSAGPNVSRNFQVSGFNSVEVAGPYEVQVRTGSGPSVSANGPQKMIDHLVVEVKGDKLLIHTEAQRGFHFGWHYNGKVHVEVTVPQLAGAAIAGSGDIHVNEVKGSAFEGSVAGSGSLGLDAVDVQTLKLSIAGSGDVKAASGRAQNVKYEIGGSGDIDAKGVEAQTADVSIAASFPDQPTAEREVYGRELYGILVIPKYFERDLLHGRASPVAIYADASYFLIYQRISGAVTAVAKTMGAEVETARLIAAHVDPALAAAATDPMPLTTVTLFNPQGGYATYVLPAAFILILQQTLLIGAGLLLNVARQGQASPTRAAPRRAPVAVGDR